MSLGEIQSGQKCKLLKINSSGKLKQKLLDMGFVMGAFIEVIREAPLYDPMELRIHNYLISLRRSEASELEVELV
jgi:ferrous iron transport protein A